MNYLKLKIADNVIYINPNYEKDGTMHPKTCASYTLEQVFNYIPENKIKDIVSFIFSKYPSGIINGRSIFQMSPGEVHTIYNRLKDESIKSSLIIFKE